jgi:hypothetical protein
MGKSILYILMAASFLPSCRQKEKIYTNIFDSPILYAQTVKELNNAYGCIRR